MEPHACGMVFYEASGYSMWPFIRQGQRLIVKECRPDSLFPGDVVAYRQGGSLICHRLVGSRACGGKKELLVRGDMSYAQPDRIDGSCVVGKVVGVMNGTRPVSYGKYPSRALGLIILAVAPLCAFAARCLQPGYGLLRGKKKHDRN